MAEGGLHVQVLLAHPRQDPRRDEVHGQPGERDDEHPAAEDPRRVVEPPDRLDEDPDRDRHQRDTVCERGEDLGAPVAEAPLGSGRPGREPGGGERQTERRHVAEHVARVGKESEAAGQQPADELDDRVGGGQGEDDGERAGAAASMGMVVRHLRVGGVIESGLLNES